MRETERALVIDSMQVQEVFTKLLNRDLLRTEDVSGMRLIYPEYLYKAEVGTARRLLALRDQAKPLGRVNADKVIAEKSSFFQTNHLCHIRRTLNHNFISCF